MAAAGSYVIQILDRISSIARGEVLGGGNSLINSLATRGWRLLEYQYSRGLFQDFPSDDRHAREEILRVKPKKAGHKGGRGGINDTKRRKVDIENEGADYVNEENIHLRDEEHVVEGRGQEVPNLFVVERLAHDVDEAGDHDETEIPNIDLSAPSYYPSFHVRPPANFQSPPAQQHDTSAQKHDTVTVHFSASFWVPSFRLLSSTDFLTPPAQVSIFDNTFPEDQQLLEELVQDEPPPLGDDGQQEKSYIGEFIVVQPELEWLQEQQPQLEPQLEHFQEQQPILEEQQAKDQENRMQLRPRNRNPPGCGTKGHKIVPPPVTQHYKSLKKKYP